jgi:hypothetical protein
MRILLTSKKHFSSCIGEDVNNSSWYMIYMSVGDSIFQPSSGQNPIMQFYQLRDIDSLSTLGMISTF